MRCYIFDIDGTLADCSHRLPYIQKSPKDWGAFFAACVDDTPIAHVIGLAKDLASAGATIVYVSGRSDECREATAEWLARHALPSGSLYMRKAGDCRDDDILKAELLSNLVADGFVPIMAFDDRDRAVEAWRSNGVPCAQVANETEFLQRHKAAWAETASRFTRDGKEWQEKTMVCGLLNGLGICPGEDEIRKDGPEPIDIHFREARFQVTEILVPARPRDKEIRELDAHVQAAESIAETMGPVSFDRVDMTPEEVLRLVEKRAAEKAAHYAGQCGGVDLVVYVNFIGYRLYPEDPFPSAHGLAEQGWRSVSMVTERLAIVFTAQDEAPAFLRDQLMQPRYWTGVDSIFE